MHRTFHSKKTKSMQVQNETSDNRLCAAVKITNKRERNRADIQGDP